MNINDVFFYCLHENVLIVLFCVSSRFSFDDPKSVQVLVKKTKQSTKQIIPDSGTNNLIEHSAIWLGSGQDINRYF